MTNWLAPQTLFAVLKLLAVVHLAALAAQPVLFGQHFSGNPDALGLHGTVGETIAWLALGQALLGILGWRRAALRLPVLLALVAIFALEGLQLHLGYTRLVTVHIPLGTALLAISLVVTLWLWRGASAQPAR